MLDIFLFFLLFTFTLAAIARDPFIFTILYLVAGAFVLGWWWSRRSIRNLRFKRTFDPYGFIGEQVPVTLEIENSGWFPIVWLRVQDGLSMEISPTRSYRRVLSLGPKQKIILTYQLEPKRRGYYPVGPFQGTSGDLLGLGKDTNVEGAADYLTVFPKIIPLHTSRLPSRSPLGALRHQLPIFEDPNRPIGKREYRVGDSFRRIDWKSSASVGNLQVKLFEPSIDMQVVILVNLCESEYETRLKTEAAELAIVTAASIANWAVERKLSTGLIINGRDVADETLHIQKVLPHKGRSHLVKLLELLARAAMGGVTSVVDIMPDEVSQLGWGTTLILITGSADDTLFQEMYRLRRAGINLVLILCGNISNHKKIEARARFYGISMYQFSRDKDLEIWRN